MKLKLLFWSAVALAVIGGRVPEANLYYFFAVQMLMLAIGSALKRRDQRRRAATLPAAAVRKPKPS